MLRLACNGTNVEPYSAKNCSMNQTLAVDVVHAHALRAQSTSAYGINADCAISFSLQGTEHVLTQ